MVADRSGATFGQQNIRHKLRSRTTVFPTHWVMSVRGILGLVLIGLGVAVFAPGQGIAAPEVSLAGRDGSPLTVTVVTDQAGRYAFPAGRLAPGHYTLHIRAIGYELAAPAGVDVGAEGPASADLALPTVADISGQLTSSEWFASMPGTAEQKRPLIECMSCHTLERVVRSKFTADEFVGVLKRMANYANNSTTQRVQVRVAERP